VFGEAAEMKKAVEIDAYPNRQHLSTDLVLLIYKNFCVSILPALAVAGF
jgi:hypothetical protein